MVIFVSTSITVVSNILCSSQKLNLHVSAVSDVIVRTIAQISYYTIG